MKTISKSSYCSGLQCLKILWLKTHCPEEAQISESTQNVFDAGHTVGNYAKQYFGDYYEIPMDFGNYNESFTLAVENTKLQIEAGTPTLCEAAFSYKNSICFADILRVNADQTVEIIEVKQTTKVKPEHYNDMAFQYYVIKNCGYTISKISLMHIDSSYVRQGDIVPQKLFKMVDCTQEVLDRQKDIPEKIETMVHYSQQNEEPEMELGEHCQNPYPCAFWEYCSKGKIIEEKKKPVSENFDKKAIQEFLSKIRYPLYHFDFETTCQEPLPPIDGASPYYPPTPFQYSLHIQKTKEEELDTIEHREFLANEFSNETVRALAEQLCFDIPKDAMVMAYNMTFEKGVILRLADIFPDLKEHLLAIHGNFIDLMSPFRSKHLQTLEMEGSYSIKKVLPALIPDLVYSDLEVQNGGMAYDTFKTLQGLSDEEKDQKRNALLAYCKMDTFAMVQILRKMELLCKEKIEDFAFRGRTDLISITIPNSVTEIGALAFKNCTNLKSIVIPDSVKEIGEKAFENCTGLTSVTIPNSVTKIGDGAFTNCINLHSVNIPDSVTEIGYCTFRKCIGLNSITIPDSVVEIGDNAFSKCMSLTSVILPNSVKKIGESAFRYCDTLTDIVIPDSVIEIGNLAFWNCTKLNSIAIPASVTKIGEDAFRNCPAYITVHPDNPLYESENGKIRKK